ncbi:MAG: type II toxin-antitoxin system ParD family antitoxin [Brachymonas sp.]|nr:type II toxin-antitoxin system ParD family antitoxin [Brachymonas sp.]
MSTVTMNISLSEDLKSFVDARMQAKGYSSTSEYMRELVRRDIERQSEERFKALIEEGLASGPGRPWDEIRADFLKRSGAYSAQQKKSAATQRKAA